MPKAFGRLLTAVGALAVIAMVTLAVAAVLVQRARTRVPARTLLEFDLHTGFVEYVPDDPVAKVTLRDRPTLRATVEALQRAADDPRVVGLVATLGAARLGTAQVQELRDALLDFRARKKFALAFAETFGEAGPGGSLYYLATAFDEIHLQPSGDVGLTGVLLETPFVRGTFDKLGVAPRLDHRYEYKNAMNTFTEQKYTAPHREALERVSQSWFNQMVRGIAAARKLSEEDVRALVDRGPFLGQEAVEAKLVDGLAYRDEVYDKARQKAGRKAELLYLDTYGERAGSPYAGGRSVALIYGVGGVERGKSGYDPLLGQFKMGSDSVAAAFRAAIADEDVKAILFRVDSPGGSYVASDTIWRETVRARKAGKPVIVSMGDLAGSGGYFVAMAADKIVAEPGTITASIGVLGGKLVTSGFWSKLGLTWDEVHQGENARLWSTASDYSPAEWARLEAGLDRVYADFTSKVAEGRKLPKEKVLEIAKGRIWTGEDAKARGLVDELGGLATAVRLARQAAHLPEGQGIQLKVFPPEKGMLERLLERGSPDNSEKAAAAVLSRTAETLRPALRALRLLDLPPPGELTLPPLEAQP